MNIGIVGPGRVAARFAKSINTMPNATLFGICGKTTAAVEDFIHKTNSAKTCIQSIDFDEFIQNDLLDIIIIATPDNSHTELVIKALQFNKHLLIEKPLCTNLEEAEKIMAAARNSSSTVALGYHLRWHTGLRLLKQKSQILRSDELSHIDLNWGHTFIQEAKWRQNPGQWWCMTTLGTHCIDILRWYFLPICGELENIHILSSNDQFNTTDETLVINMCFQNGTTANINCSILLNEPFSLRIHTQKGLICAEDMMGLPDNRKIVFYDKVLPFSSDNDLYRDELNDLIRAIVENSEPEVTLDEGYKNMRCMYGRIQGV
jgi:predicted dehydrogenase